MWGSRARVVVLGFLFFGIGATAIPPTVSPSQIADELRAVATLVSTAAPQGFVSVFGGARVAPVDPQYELVRRFGRLWVAGDSGIPVATGGGPGNMEAANRGAKEAGGLSLGFVMADMPGETENPFLTHHLVFRSFPYRESELIDRARAIVLTRGGVGTHWELFQALAKMHTGKIGVRNLILLGPRDEWNETLDLAKALVDQGRMTRDMLDRLRPVTTAEEAVALARAELDGGLWVPPSQGNVEEDTTQIRNVILRSAPRGFVAVFGGSRVSATEASYRQVRALAGRLARVGIPVATGGGPGIMEAANLGALENGGVSLGFAMAALPGQDANPHVTDGYTATAFAQREAEMIDGASAIVLADGGPGTQWELFEALSKMLTEQMAPKPIVLLGAKAIWAPALRLLDTMVAKGLMAKWILNWVTWTDDVDVATRLASSGFPDCKSALFVASGGP